MTKVICVEFDEQNVNETSKSNIIKIIPPCRFEVPCLFRGEVLGQRCDRINRHRKAFSQHDLLRENHRFRRSGGGCVDRHFESSKASLRNRSAGCSVLPEELEADGRYHMRRNRLDNRAIERDKVCVALHRKQVIVFFVLRHWELILILLKGDIILMKVIYCIFLLYFRNPTYVTLFGKFDSSREAMAVELYFPGEQKAIGNQVLVDVTDFLVWKELAVRTAIKTEIPQAR